MKSKGKSWTRDEEIIVFYIYRTETKISINNPRVQEIASLMNRTADSVVMKVSNFKSFDKINSGLSNATKLDKEIWDEFGENLIELTSENNRILSRGITN